MIRKLMLLAVLGLFLAACQSAPSLDDVKATARKFLDGENKQKVQITNVVAGNTKTVKADGVWCVETDQKNDDGTTTLLSVYLKGGVMTTSEMDSEYEWDLNGCPRQ